MHFVIYKVKQFAGSFSIFESIEPSEIVEGVKSQHKWSLTIKKPNPFFFALSARKEMAIDGYADLILILKHYLYISSSIFRSFTVFRRQNIDIEKKCSLFPCDGCVKRSSFISWNWMARYLLPTNFIGCMRISALFSI